VILSPGFPEGMIQQVLEEMAQAPDAFRQWRASAGGAVVGAMEHWSEIFRMAGSIHHRRDLAQDRFEEILKEARAVIRCRGVAWAAGDEAALRRIPKKTLWAPDAAPVGLASDVWADPARLSERIEDTVMGISKTGEKP
jgi:hypothetical protein